MRGEDRSHGHLGEKTDVSSKALRAAIMAGPSSAGDFRAIAHPGVGVIRRAQYGHNNPGGIVLPLHWIYACAPQASRFGLYHVQHSTGYECSRWKSYLFLALAHASCGSRTPRLYQECRYCGIAPDQFTRCYHMPKIPSSKVIRLTQVFLVRRQFQRR
jgi:hypothetical protein